MADKSKSAGIRKLRQLSIVYENDLLDKVLKLAEISKTVGISMESPEYPAVYSMAATRMG